MARPGVSVVRCAGRHSLSRLLTSFGGVCVPPSGPSGTPCAAPECNKTVAWERQTVIGNSGNQKLSVPLSTLPCAFALGRGGQEGGGDSGREALLGESCGCAGERHRGPSGDHQATGRSIGLGPGVGVRSNLRSPDGVPIRIHLGPSCATAMPWILLLSSLPDTCLSVGLCPLACLPDCR